MGHDSQLPREDQQELNLSMNGGDDSRKQRLAKSAVVLTRWFRKWSDSFPSHDVTKLQMATYLEALDDLTPEQLEIGCREATRKAEQFPKPGHIRSALYAAGVDEQRHERPKYLDEAPLTPEEREEAATFSRAYRELLEEKQAEMDTAKVQILAENNLYDIEEQLAAYRKWLEAQVNQDSAERANGLSPIPRSETERLAMYMSLPLAERKRIAKSGEWTKTLTKNM